MENIKISKVCGLCAGCKRAINCAKEELKSGKVTIFKEIVHNNNVNNMLRDMGAEFVDNIEELDASHTVIIRAHGEPPATYAYLESNNIPYRDCTCPNVLKIHEQVEEYSKQGYKVIILGKFHNGIHPEVLGTTGWVRGDAILIENEDDLNKLDALQYEKVYLVCQTTFNIDKANNLIQKIEEILTENGCQLVINRSMCNAQRQINLYSAELAREVDMMIVMGGRKSSNSLELYKNVSKICPTIFIENVDEYGEAVSKLGIEITPAIKIGITAGASTMTEELLALKQRLEREFIKGTHIIKKSFLTEFELDSAFNIIKDNMINLGFDVSNKDKEMWCGNIKQNLCKEDFYFYLIYQNGRIEGFIEVVKSNGTFIVSEVQLSNQSKRTRVILEIIKFLYNSKEFEKEQEFQFSILKNNNMSNRTFAHLGGEIISENERKFKYKISRDNVKNYLIDIKTIKQ